MPDSFREALTRLALAEGFSAAGVTGLPHLREGQDAAHFEEFIASGHAGTMHWLERVNAAGKRVRAHPQTPFPWARSVIVCAANYHVAQPLSVDPSQSGAGWIARYAWTSRPADPAMPASSGTARERVPSDYHRVLLKRLRRVEAGLKDELGPFESRAYVDTGPVSERALAVAAGLGWTGKNTCLIHPERGSFNFLAVIVTSLECLPMDPQTLLVPDRCGSCRRCIEACPTEALIAPYQMDASRCISYLTVEHRGPIAEDLMSAMGRQVFGCDICQDVCPWNRKAPIAVDSELAARSELVNPALEWLGSLEEEEFERRFNGSPIRRAGFSGLRRNVAIAMGNSGQRRFANRLRAWAESADDGLRAAARWAINKMDADDPAEPMRKNGGTSN